MRRALLLALVVAGLLAAVLLLGFSVSRYNVREQGFRDSLADFLFLNTAYAALAFDPRPSVVDEERLAFALRRYRGTTHREVKEVAARYIARWQVAAIPHLARAAQRDDAPLLEGVARALAAIGGPATLPVLLDIIGRQRMFEHDRPEDLRGPPLELRHRLIRALSATRTREAAALLIGIHRRQQANRLWAPMILAEIANTGHGAPFLLDAARQSAGASELADTIWPLARTQDPAAIEFLVGLFARPELPIRRRVRDALDQAAGPAAVPAVLVLLEETRDEQLKAWLINSILDDRDARDLPEVVAALEPLLTHPALAWEARYALVSIGTQDAYAAIARQFDRLDPDGQMRELEFAANANAVPLIERYLRSPDPMLRRMMLDKLPGIFVPEAAPLIPPLLTDSDPGVRNAARVATLYMDRVLFWKRLTGMLPEGVGTSLFHALRPTYFGAALDHLLPLMRLVHAAGVALSALLAVGLLFGRVKVVEPYRFELFAAFLLLEGLVGDFLLLEFGRDPLLLLQVATGCHLALLAGVLLQPREHLPGELAGRFERLMGASMWLLMPLLLVFTAPVLSTAVRQALHGTAWSLTLLALCALVTVLVVEQWALRWSLLPRRAATERWLAALIWIVFSVLLLIAMLARSDELWASGRRDDAVFVLIVAAPLLWLPLASLHGLLFVPRVPRPLPLPPVPGTRFAAADLGGLVALRPRAASLGATLLKAGIVLATAVAAALMAGWEGRGLSLLLALVVAPVGAAVATLAIALVVPAWTIHVRGGFVRVAASRAGMAFWHTGWRRRLVLPLALQRALAPQADADGAARRGPLCPEEVAWIAKAVERSARAKPAGGGRS